MPPRLELQGTAPRQRHLGEGHTTTSDRYLNGVGVASDIPATPPLVLTGQLDIYGTVNTKPPVAPRSKTAQPAPKSGFGHTTIQAKCWHCLNDIANDPTAPASRAARVLWYKPEGVVYLCVNHAVLVGYSGRFAPKERGRD